MTVETRMEGTTLVADLSGSIDSLSSPQMEETIRAAIDRHAPEAIVLDCDKLEYITSAGLRVILRLKQRFDNFRLIKKDVTDEEIVEVCKTACVHDDIMKLPEGYDTVIGEGGCSPAASVSGSRWPGPCSGIIRSSCSTRPPPPWTTRPRQLSATP